MIDTEHFKKRLNAEQERLVTELKEVGVRSAENPKDWEATAGAHDDSRADQNEVADRLEEYGERSAMGSTLEARLLNVTDALARMEAGNYGFCEVGGERHEIERERLDANPAAKNCLTHLDEEVN